MKKTIFKCDVCGKEINSDKESHYYNFREIDLPGWGSIDYSMGDDTNYDLCKDCFKKLKIKKLEGKTLKYN
jgi:endogenous inhibitor of DNA gyrase (YacG/DUF329 family)